MHTCRVYLAFRRAAKLISQFPGDGGININSTNMFILALRSEKYDKTKSALCLHKWIAKKIFQHIYLKTSQTWIPSC